MTARARIDTPEGTRAVVDSIKKGQTPPISLNPRQLFYFDIVVESREGATWTKNDLMLAVHMAKTYERMEMLNNDLDEEGYVQLNDKGHATQNPKLIALGSATMALQTLIRALGLTATQKGINHPSQRDRNREAAAIADGLKKAPDSLI